MTQTTISEETKELIELISLSEIVKIDDQLYILQQGKSIDALLTEKFEDLEVVFETHYHIFDWWEIREDTKKINNREWQIGQNIVSFYTIQPT